MDNRLLVKAECLAKQRYQVQVFPDETTDGKPILIAIVPDLPGCSAHGNTAAEAKARLRDVMVDFIYFMLEDGLEVPVPTPIETDISLQLGDSILMIEASASLTFGTSRSHTRKPPEHASYLRMTPACVAV